MPIRTTIAPKMEGNFVEITFETKQMLDEQARFLGGHSELEHLITKSRHFESRDRATNGSLKDQANR